MRRWLRCFTFLLWLPWPTLAEDLFRPFETVNPQLTGLQDFVAEKIAVPDSYMSLSPQRYLVIVTQTGTMGHGLYLVDMNERYAEKVVGGLLKIEALVLRSREPLWLLMSSGGMTRGIMWTQFAAIQFHRDAHGNSVPQRSWLLYVEEDGEAGFCGNEPERAKHIGLNSAMTVNSYILQDLNSDGIDDISFSITEADCVTGMNTNFTKNYLFSENGLQEQTEH